MSRAAVTVIRTAAQPFATASFAETKHPSLFRRALHAADHILCSTSHCASRNLEYKYGTLYVNSVSSSSSAAATMCPDNREEVTPDFPRESFSPPCPPPCPPPHDGPSDPPLRPLPCLRGYPNVRELALHVVRILCCGRYYTGQRSRGETDMAFSGSVGVR